jgi:hypothetical protein
MGKRTPQYTLAKLVSTLETTVPGMLDRLPSIEFFTFIEDMDGLLRLRIGTVCSVVPVCATITGKAKPKVLYESGKVFKSYYDPGKEEEWRKVTLVEPFLYFRTGGEEWKEKLMALVSFLFLQAGHVKQFIDLNGGKGVPMLIAALKTLPDPAVDRKDSLEPEKYSEDMAEKDHVSVGEKPAASTSASDSSTDKTSADGNSIADTSAPSNPVTDVPAKKSPAKKNSAEQTRAKKTSAAGVSKKKTPAKKTPAKKASPKKSAEDEQLKDKMSVNSNEDQVETNSESDFPISESKNKKKRTFKDFLEDETDERKFTLATPHLILNADFVIVVSAPKIQKL